MMEAIIAITSTILGAILGFFLALYQSNKERERAAKDIFFVVIADMRAKLDEMRERPDSFFKESISILRQAIYRVRPFLNDQQWVILQKEWRDYESQQKWFESPERTVAFFVHTEKKISPNALLENFLDRFESCAAGRPMPPKLCYVSNYS